MRAPTITGFHVRTDDDRTLDYATDPDLTAELLRGGTVTGDATSTAYVLVMLGIDGEPCDSIEVDNNSGGDVETLDRAIAVLQAAREGLLS